jgi:hypothetical protein
MFEYIQILSGAHNVVFNMLKEHKFYFYVSVFTILLIYSIVNYFYLLRKTDKVTPHGKAYCVACFIGTRLRSTNRHKVTTWGSEKPHVVLVRPNPVCRRTLPVSTNFLRHSLTDDLLTGVLTLPGLNEPRHISSLAVVSRHCRFYSNK